MSVPMEPAERIAAQRREFAFFEEGNIEVFKKRALGGTLRDSLVRSVSWKVFLGALSSSPTQWADEALKWRSLYSTHVSEHWVDPHSVSQPDDDPTINNPLSQAHDSTWNKFFKNRELQQEIQKDLDRLFPEYAFFQEKEPQSQMMKVLFVWSKTHPNTSYRQGMHELLAPILWLTSKESVPVASDYSGSRDLYQNILDSRYVEHDSFALFSKLMEQMEGLFEHNNTKPANQPPPDATAGPAAAAPVTPIIRKCNRIFSSLLKTRDPDVYKQLTALDIEPQFFLLRWLRCLFGREFHLEDVMVLWDAIFADSHTLALSDFICVAMLKFIRSDLIGKDQSSCLRRLMKYPPVEDVYSFVDQALRLRSPSHVSSHTTRTAPFAPSVDDRAPEAFYGQAKKTLVSALKHPQKRVSAPKQSPVAPAIPMEVTRRLAAKMNTLLEILEKSSTDSESFQASNVLVAIAQMKQIRDVLNGVLSIESIDLIDVFESQEQASQAAVQDSKTSQSLGKSGGADVDNADAGATSEDAADYDKCSVEDANNTNPSPTDPLNPTPSNTSTTQNNTTSQDSDTNNNTNNNNNNNNNNNTTNTVASSTAVTSSTDSAVGSSNNMAMTEREADGSFKSSFALPWDDGSSQPSIIQDMTSSSTSLQPPILKPPEKKGVKKVTLQDTGLLDLFDSSSDSFLSSKKSDTSSSLFGSSLSSKPKKVTTPSASLFDEMPSTIEDTKDDDIFGLGSSAAKKTSGTSAATSSVADDDKPKSKDFAKNLFSVDDKKLGDLFD